MTKDLLKPQTSPSLLISRPQHCSSSQSPGELRKDPPKPGTPALILVLYSRITRAETMTRTTAQGMMKIRRLPVRSCGLYSCPVVPQNTVENTAGQDKAAGAATPQELGPCTHLPNNRQTESCSASSPDHSIHLSPKAQGSGLLYRVVVW